MLAKERRLVGEVGEGASTSLLIRVPKVWARSVGVRKGSEVTIVFGFGDLLIVAPPGREAEIDRFVGATGVEP